MDMHKRVQRLPTNIDSTYYRFEDNIAKHFFSINPNRRSMSVQQAQYFAEEIMHSELSPEYRPRFTAINGKMAYADYDNLLLKMPEWSWNSWVIVHELAHFVRNSSSDYQYGEGAHSAAFALTHFKLACKWIPHTHGPDLLMQIWEYATRFHIRMDHPDEHANYPQV